MLASFLVLLLALDTCADCTLSGLDTTLCEPHAGEERTAFNRERSHLSSKDPAVRVQALDALAALTTSHANAPSSRVAERIASLLEDDDFAVREHAAALLGPPQHALACLEALTGALAGLKREWEPLNVEADKLSSKLGGKLSDQKRASLVKDLQACNEKRKRLSAWRRAMMARLAHFPDDRAVDAILVHTHRNLLGGGEVALVQLGNRSSVGALAESIVASERDLVEAERQLAREESGTVTLARAMKLNAFAEMVVLHAQSLEELRLAFAEHGLTAPEGAETEAWTAWIAEQTSAFPEHLPGLSSPAW